MSSNTSIFLLLQRCHDTRTQLYQGLLREHRKLKTEDRKLRTGLKEQFNKLALRVKDMESKFFLRLSNPFTRNTHHPNTYSYPNRLLL